MKHRIYQVISEIGFRWKWIRSSAQRRPYLDFMHRSEFFDVDTPEKIDFLHTYGSIHFFARNGIWLVTGFEAAEKVLADTATFSNKELEEYLLFDTHEVMIRADGERHARINELIADAFMLYKDESYLRHVRDRLERQTSLLRSGSSVDMKLAFTDPVAAYSFCLLAGFNPEDSEKIVSRFHDGDVLSFLQWFMTFMETVSIPDYAVHSEASLLARLQSSIRSGSITEEEARVILKVTLVASTETVSSTFQRVFEIIRRDQEMRERLRSQESIRAKFIDEVVRMYPPPQWLKRKTTVQTDLLGVNMPAGSIIVVDLRAANRDPSKFDRPACLHVDGNRHRHLGFGAGIHKCLGMGIARTQARLFLDHFLDRVEDFVLEDVRWMMPRNITIMSTDSMKIRWIQETSEAGSTSKCPFSGLRSNPQPTDHSTQ